jgi:hypothetical protein
VPAAGESATSPSPDALASAHARLLKDRALQFDFRHIAEPKHNKPPGWLEAIGRFLGHVFQVLAPLMTYVFWAGVALIVGLVAFLIVREVFGIRLGWTKKARPPRPRPVDWRPEASKARALLEDADRLAAEGRYDEAVHLLLYRSIDDIEGRRPRLVRPALTSRDIAALEAVPGAAREAFTKIAHVVEASFFGGRQVDRAGFAACRSAYEAFAFPEAWA